MAGLNECFAEAELVVTDAPSEIGIIGRIRGVGFYHDFGLHPRPFGTVPWVQPVVDKDQFRVGFRFISQAVFGAGSGGLECNLLPAFAVQTVPGAKISVKFKPAQLVLQLPDLYIRLSAEAPRRVRR